MYPPLGTIATSYPDPIISILTSPHPMEHLLYLLIVFYTLLWSLLDCHGNPGYLGTFGCKAGGPEHDLE